MAIGTLKPSLFTDVKVGDKLAEYINGEAIYSHDTWYLWTGKRWEADSREAVKGRITRFARDMVLDALDEQRQIVQEGGKSEDSSYLKNAVKYQDDRKIKALLSILQTLCYQPTEFDMNYLELNTPDGIIDLSTGELKPHDKGRLHSQMTAVSPSACGQQQWLDMLNTVTDGNTDVIEYLQQVCGLALIGKPFEQQLVIVYGEHGTGKSTLFNALYKVLGSYAGTISPDVFMVSASNRNGEMTGVEGKRFVLSAELDQGQYLSSAMLKRMCSTDPVNVRPLYKDSRTILPTWHCFMYTNELPQTLTSDAATWDRLRLIPFNHVITGSAQQVQDYASVLFDQAGGAILRWAIQGAVKVIGNGYKVTTPRDIVELIEAQRETGDIFTEFIEDNFKVGEGLCVRASVLYDEFSRFIQPRRVTISRRTLARELESRGYWRRTDTEHITWFNGLAIDARAHR